MQWGGTADRDDSRAMFDTCRAAGITHFDTAWVYTDGASETLLGEFTKSCREDIFIATKVGYIGGAGSANIIKQFDTCRTRLQTDYVDLLYMHIFDDDTPLEETFETLAALQSDGHIRQIGVSNYAAWQVMKAQGVAAKLGTHIDWIQPMYSLVKRQVEVEILPMTRDQGISVASYSPLGGGLLTGKYAGGATGRLTTDERYKTRYDVDWMRKAAVGLSDLAQSWGYHPASLAVAWVRAQGVNPIISARNVGQLEPSLAAKDIALDPEQIAAITALSENPPPATDRLEEA